MRNQQVLLDLRKFQAAQEQHDQLAHRDILSLPVPKRLTHFTLHFSKYVGLLAKALAVQDAKPLVARVITDSFVIVLASANALSLDLGASMDSQQADKGPMPTDFLRLVLRFADLTGGMAKACEALDHLEDYPFRSSLERATRSLVPTIVAMANSHGIDLSQTVTERWRAVEQKGLARRMLEPAVPEPRLYAAA